jgi:predicted Fe-S protein YdhL (DUF1289 family)
MSICKNICKVDQDTNTFCVGCGRTLDEITEWFTAGQERKIEIAKAARKRSKEHRRLALDKLIETDAELL